MQCIPLSRGLQALVDDEDYEALAAHNWYAARDVKTGRSYATRMSAGGQRNRHRIWMHRVITDAPPGMQVDHINLDTLDNRRKNLRLASRADNAKNSPLQANNTSGFKGVCWHRRRGMWVAMVGVANRQQWLGAFADAREAAAAYDEAARRLYGPFARLNFPRPGEAAAVRS